MSGPLSLAFSPDGEWLASGGRGGELSLWNARTGQNLWRTQAHRSRVLGLTFSSDGRRLASGGFDQLIHVWDFATRQKVSTLRGHLNEVWSLEFSPDDRFLVSSSKDGTVKLWDVRANPLQDQWWLDSGESALGFAAVGGRLITISTNGQTLRHWEGAQAVKTVALEVPLSPGWESRLVFSPKSGHLVVGETNGTVRVLSVETGAAVRSVKVAEGLFTLRTISADERWLVGSTDIDNAASSLWIWDYSSGATVTRLAGFRMVSLKINSNAKRFVTISRDSRLLAFTSTNYTVQVWDLLTQHFVKTLGGNVWHVKALNFSEDGKYLASGGWEGVVRVWSLATGQEIVPPLRGHRSGINDAHFSPDGQMLVTTGDDHSARFWHLPTGREMLLINDAGDADMGSGSFLSPTGHELVLWDFARQSQRVERIPTMAEIEAAEATTNQNR